MNGQALQGIEGRSSANAIEKARQPARKRGNHAKGVGDRPEAVA